MSKGEGLLKPADWGASHDAAGDAIQCTYVTTRLNSIELNFSRSKVAIVIVVVNFSDCVSCSERGRLMRMEKSRILYDRCKRVLE